MQPERLAQFGLRVIEGEHVTLITDLPSSPGVNELPQIAEAALPQMADYFGVPQKKLKDWRVNACVIADQQKFTPAGMLSAAEHRGFKDGLSMGYELWIRDQPSDYYRRALFLHELTHTFMSTHLGGCGPGWYMEATAELMGAHRMETFFFPGTGRKSYPFALGVIPRSREVSPEWGRIPLIRNTARPLSVGAVMKIDNRQALEVKHYAWVWALAVFLDHHPRYQERWRSLPEIVLAEDFDRQFIERYRRDAPDLMREWQLFCRTLVYGHDVAREAIAFGDGEKFEPGDSKQVRVDVARGWQCARMDVSVGNELALAAKGRFVIAREADGMPWPCEANGVTLRYYEGRPLGQLLLAVDDRSRPVDAPGGFANPIAVGLGGKFTMPLAGTVYLRVNDSPAELAENEGNVSVTVSRAD